MAAVTTPSSPLDLSRVSYDKCVASIQSRFVSVQADDELNQTHIQIPMDMNNISDAPIKGQTLEQFTVTKEFN